MGEHGGSSGRIGDVIRIVVIALALGAFGALAWRGNLLGVRNERPFGSVATAFSQTTAASGYAWTRDGRHVGTQELWTFSGPDHCHWESATLLFIAWPPGTAASNASSARLYVRDPQGVMAGLYGEPLERNAKVPSDARPTGYRLGVVELYLSPSDQDRFIYVVSPSDAERWPRSDPIRLCA